jgi:putative glycosyltransferase (TIGR04372 family)
MWNKADYLFGRGDYWASFDLRNSAIRRVYELQGVSNSNQNYYPHFINSAFTVAIGHLGSLYLHKIAEAVGILPEGKRNVLVGNRVANQSALDFITERQIATRTFDFSGIVTMSHIIENYQILKCKEGFLDQYQLWQRVFEATSGLEVDFLKNQKLKSSIDLEMGKSRLKSKSVDLEAPIALIHLRNNGNVEEVRNVDVESYIDCIKKLRSLGYQICQIGVNRHNALSRYLEGVFEFSEKSEADNQADFYLMLFSDIFIGTTSGPAIFPTLFGIPSLITNLTSMSRNAFSSNSTLYVPKIVLNSKGVPLDLQEQFRNRFAFGGEFFKRQFKKANFDLKDVTRQELVASLDELLDRLRSGKIEVTKTDGLIAELRANVRTVSSGKISNSFIKNNFNI